MVRVHVNYFLHRFPTLQAIVLHLIKRILWTEQFRHLNNNLMFIWHELNSDGRSTCKILKVEESTEGFSNISEENKCAQHYYYP